MKTQIIVKVEATVIDSVHIYVPCPFCKKRRTKRVHRFGSDNNLSNRVESRGSHCITKIDADINFLIYITSNTIRI